MLRLPAHGRMKVTVGANSYVAELRHIIGARLAQAPPQIRLIYGGDPSAALRTLTEPQVVTHRARQWRCVFQRYFLRGRMVLQYLLPCSLAQSDDR